MADRNERGLFQKGHKMPGPGRPRGSSELARFKSTIGDRLPELYQKLFEDALAGDAPSKRLILERLIPVSTAQVQEILDRLDRLEGIDNDAEVDQTTG